MNSFVSDRGEHSYISTSGNPGKNPLFLFSSAPRFFFFLLLSVSSEPFLIIFLFFIATSMMSIRKYVLFGDCTDLRAHLLLVWICESEIAIG